MVPLHFTGHPKYKVSMPAVLDFWENWQQAVLVSNAGGSEWENSVFE